MTTIPRPTPFPLPNRGPAQTPQSVTITSQVIYRKGPWGNGRPLRTFGMVAVKARHLHTSLGRFTTIEDLGDALLDGDGKFTLTITPPLTTDDIFLVVTENYTNNEFVFQLMDPKAPQMNRIDRTRVGKQFVGNDWHRIRVDWPPPRTDFAYVNATKFSDTQKLARMLSDLLINPSYPTTISIAAETANGFVGGDYTTGFLLYDPFVKGTVPQDFVPRLVAELKSVMNFAPASSKSSTEAMRWALDRFVTMNIDYLESTKVLDQLLRAIAKALNQTVLSTMVDDVAPDAAAACGLLFVAGLMARDRAKVTVSYGSVNYAEMQMRHFNAVHVSITR